MRSFLHHYNSLALLGDLKIWARDILQLVMIQSDQGLQVSVDQV